MNTTDRIKVTAKTVGTVLGIIILLTVAGAVIAMAGEAMIKNALASEIRGDEPLSARETCTLYYLSERARTDGQPFYLYCSSTRMGPFRGKPETVVPAPTTVLAKETSSPPEILRWKKTTGRGKPVCWDYADVIPARYPQVEANPQGKQARRRTKKRPPAFLLTSLWFPVPLKSESESPIRTLPTE